MCDPYKQMSKKMEGANMNILMIGSGGREHALIRKLKESPQVEQIYCAPGNGGIACDAQCVHISATDIDGVVKFAKENPVDLVFVAPDDPLAAGMVDALQAAGIAAFGPSKAAAQIEGSKVFSKNLMKKYNIPTAGYAVFDRPEDVLAYISEKNKYPAVIKADGLALGKGVILAQSFAEAKQAVKTIMEDKAFGAAGSRVVVEAFLTGPEVSVLAFTDGETVVPMVSSKDHKRIFNSNQGPNTGGMGTISPNPHYDQAMAARCMKEIFLPTVEAMNAEGCRFKGCLYFGLMLTQDGPKVIEYNARFGDPETQVVLPLLKTDLVDIMQAIMEERLDQLPIEWHGGACACVIMASGGYPGSYQKGIPIRGLDTDGQLPGVTVYHAGTVKTEDSFATAGGRVLGVTGMGETLEQALEKAYAAVEQIEFEGAQYRTDIGRI